MKYPRALKSNSGVTLMEVLITMGIFAVLIVATTPFTFKFYQRYQFNNERSLFVSTLERARTASLGGQSSTDHGIYITDTTFTLFEGSSYATRTTSKDEVFSRSTAVSITGPNEFKFNYLSGRTASVSFTLSSNIQTTKIHVNKEGRIEY